MPPSQSTELWGCNLSDIGAFNFTGVHKVEFISV